MRNYLDGMRKLTIILLLLLSFSSASALQQLVSLQGKVDYGGVLVKSGDLAVAIYDNSTGGNMVYNSSGDFNKSIVNGYFDVMLGSARNLSLDSNRVYWLDASVNGTDIDWGSDERLQFQSPVGGGAVFTSDITQTGKINLSVLGQINDIFVYDTTRDSDGGAWTCDERAKASSWYNETLNDADRGKDRCFPKKAILVTNGTSIGSNLIIYDAKDMNMWMIFTSKNKNLLTGGGTGNTLGPVFALNGKIYVGITAGDNGLAIADFVRDEGLLYYSATSPYIYNGTISERNNGRTNTAGTMAGIVNTIVNDVHAAVINGKTYVAVATDGGVSVINENTGTVVSQGGGASYAVFIANDGSFYYQLTGSAGLCVKYGVDKATSFDCGLWYNGVGSSKGTAVAIISGSAGIQTIYATSGTSVVDGKSNTIYLGGVGTQSFGLAQIHEKQNDEAHGAVKYYSKDYIGELLVGDIKGYWDLGNTSAANATDRSVRANHLNISGSITLGGVAGVRGNATNFGGAGFLATPDKVSLSLTGNASYGAWVKISALGANDQTIMMKKHSTTSFPKLMYGRDTNAGYGTSGNWNFNNNAANCGTLNSAVGNDTNWHFIIGSYDGVSQYLYIDGEMVASGACSTGQDTDGPFIIGSGTTEAGGGLTTNYFNGVIDEAFVTNETLSNATIRYMYLSGKRALMANDRTSNQLFGNSNNVTAVAVDDRNEFIYAGTQSLSEGGAVSKIGIESDLRDDYWADSSHADDFGTAFAQDNVRAVSAHADILAFATNYSFWAETKNWSMREHMENAFNPHGANLVQDKITTNYIDVKDGQKLVIGNNVNNNVKVGIGTTNPTERLQVAGNINVTSNLYFGAGDAYLYRDSTYGIVAGSNGLMGINALYIYNSAVGRFDITTNGAAFVFNTHILPDADNSRTLGNSTFRWASISVVSKPATVITKTYGTRNLLARESPENRFIDEGLSNLTNGEARIDIDPMFLETVNTTTPYFVYLTSYDESKDLYVAKMNETYFVVKSNNTLNGRFGWQISAMRLGFEHIRLPTPEELDNNSKELNKKGV